IALGSKLFPALIAQRRELLKLLPTDIDKDADWDGMAAHLKLRPRKSSIIGIYRDALRHTDGAFTRAYHVELSPTLFSNDLVIENRCDAYARMLAARKPVGTIIQFRLTADVDPGRAIALHDMTRDFTGIHSEALLLHVGGIRKYEEMALLGC